MVHFTRACKTLLSENNKTRLTFEKQQEKNKNIICRPWSVRIEKNCALGLEHGPRPAASGRTQDLWHSFSQYGPPGRQIIYIYLHFSLITSWHRVKLWEESAIAEAIGIQRGYPMPACQPSPGEMGGSQITVEVNTFSEERLNLYSGAIGERKASPTLQACAILEDCVDVTQISAKS